MSEKRQRNKIVRVRLNDEEEATLKELADHAGLSVSGYLRSQILSRPPLRQSPKPRSDAKALARLLGSLGRVGSNLNQMAHLGHLGGWPGHHEIVDAVKEVQAMRNTLMEALRVAPAEKRSSGQ